MGTLARRHAIAILLTALIILIGVAPASALDIPAIAWGDRTVNNRPRRVVTPEGPKGGLQEVTAPGGVQQLRSRLDGHHPRLTLKNPQDGAVLSSKELELVVEVEDWPLVSDPDLGLGPHIALQIDNEPPLRFSSGETSSGAGLTVKATLPALTPGSHRLSAYAAYPWGEAVKEPGASLNWRLHQFQPLKGTQPDRNAPWMVMVSPAELGNGQPLLLDWLIWNAPLQNLREGDGRWRLRLTLNGDSFLVDRQDAIWVRQNEASEIVQMELLDGLGDPIDPTFNNQLRFIPPRTRQKPAWLQSRLSESDVARLVGDPAPSPEPEPAAALPQADSPEPKTEDTNKAPSVEESVEETDVPIQVEEDNDNNSGTNDSLDEQSTAMAEVMTEAMPPISERSNRKISASGIVDPTSPPPTKSAEKEQSPTISLGGSDREPLNTDEPQR
ncbi:hypothetical protein [Synechococcus sp. UW140]|uniref:hypothetical protein n=1 Tax=Synechococcus sp. UW140 TaxID=368503 RepID=UPI000E0F6B28|nr:hypothetical protein [Synechococcus sp. UW140]